MRNLLLLLALLPLAAFPAAAESGSDTAVESRETVSARNPVYAGVSQQDFERFMRCYGHMSGSLDLLERIRPDIADTTQIEAIRRDGIRLMNDSYARPYDRLARPGYGLDLFQGEMARQDGRRIFDSAETLETALQYERFRKFGAVSQDCLDLSRRLDKLTQTAPRRAETGAQVALQSRN